MSKFKVAEKFISINGEARRAGETACFIRFTGCNLNCTYCDTSWANEKNAPYEIMSEEEIYTYIKDSGINNITITGGEPLIQKDIKRLLMMLSKDKDLNVEVETNGSVLLLPFIDIADNISFTMDYKSESSGMEKYMCMENMELLRENDTVKFVVQNKNDLDKMYSIVKRYKLDERLKVYVSAVFGKIKPAEIAEYLIFKKMNNVRLQLQIHKYIWEPDRKGV